MYFKDLDVDVIIVGAGVSGLTAAFAILERDPLVSVLVLEANETVGGRTRSAPMETTQNRRKLYDIGGHFVSSRQTHLMNLLDKLEIEIQEYDTRGSTLEEFFDHTLGTSDNFLPIFGNEETKFEVIQFYKKLERLCDQISLENPMGSVKSTDLDSITMEEYICDHLSSTDSVEYLRNVVKTTCGKLIELIRSRQLLDDNAIATQLYVVKQLFRMILGADPSDISALFYLAFCNSAGGVLIPFLRQKQGGRSSYIKGGTVYLLEKIVSEVGEQNIMVDSPVVKISRSDHEVIVYTTNQQFKCRCVILSVPPKQLLGINFEPELNPGRVDILKDMRGRRWMQFIVTYREQFWTNLSYNGDVFCNNINHIQNHIVIVLNISTQEHAALMGLVDLGRAYLHQRKPTLDEEIFKQLATYFGDDALEPIDYFEKYWPDFNFEGFMACSPPPGIMSSFHEIRRPIGRLFFAGAETATYWYGHIAGAVQAGLRAALEVLYEIRPQVLNYQDFLELRPKRELETFFQDRDNLYSATYSWMCNATIVFLVSYAAYLLVEYCMMYYEHDPSISTIPPELLEENVYETFENQSF